MPADASIYGHLQPIQPVNRLAQLAQMAQIQGLQGQQAMNAYALKKAEREDTEANGLNALYAAAVGPDGKIDRNALIARAAQQNLGSRIPGMTKQFAEQDKAEADLRAANATASKNDFDAKTKKLDLIGQTMNFVRQNPTPQTAGMAVDYLLNNGILDAAGAQKYRDQFAASPGEIGSFAEMAFRGALDAKEQLAKVNTNNLGGQTVTQSVDPVSGAVRTLGAQQNTQSPDNAATNARAAADAAAGRAQAERHFQANQNAPQYMETNEGLVALPKKLAPGQQPTGTPVMGANGQPLGKPLKDIPPTVNSAIIQNTQSLNQVNRALNLLAGKDVGDPATGGQKGDKHATGLKGYLPQQALNWVDPQGVDMRAEIADIGSLKIHDRSGAAVTVSEAPRLMPFIPQATDAPDVVKKKLQRLRTEIQNEANALATTYSKEQGYKPSPVRAGGATGEWSIQKVN